MSPFEKRSARTAHPKKASLQLPAVHWSERYVFNGGTRNHGEMRRVSFQADKTLSPLKSVTTAKPGQQQASYQMKGALIVTCEWRGGRPMDICINSVSVAQDDAAQRNFDELKVRHRWLEDFLRKPGQNHILPVYELYQAIGKYGLPLRGEQVHPRLWSREALVPKPLHLDLDKHIAQNSYRNTESYIGSRREYWYGSFGSSIAVPLEVKAEYVEERKRGRWTAMPARLPGVPGVLGWRQYPYVIQVIEDSGRGSTGIWFSIFATGMDSACRVSTKA